jgi:hypothetical protein
VNKEDSRAAAPVAVEVWQRKVSATPFDDQPVETGKVRLYRDMHILSSAA